MDIVIAGGSTAVRTGLCLELSAVAGWRVVGETDGAAGVARLLLRHRPDVLVLDLDVPRGAEPVSLASIVALRPGTPVVAIGTGDARPHALRALKAGAVSYVPKVAVNRDLVAAVRRAGS